MMINIIHNSGKADRYTVLMKELKEQGIEQWNLWDSIHGLSSVVKCINAAHKQVVQYAKDEDLPEVIVGEDDLKFLGEGAYDYFVANKPEVYDLYLASIFLGIIEKDNTVKQFTGLTLYYCHSSFYDTFLNTAEDIHLDAALAGLGRYVVCEPFIAIQHNGISSQTSEYQNYDSLFKHRKLYTNDDNRHRKSST